MVPGVGHLPKMAKRLTALGRTVAHEFVRKVPRDSLRTAPIMSRTPPPAATNTWFQGVPCVGHGPVPTQATTSNRAAPVDTPLVPVDHLRNPPCRSPGVAPSISNTPIPPLVICWEALALHMPYVPGGDGGTIAWLEGMGVEEVVNPHMELGAL